MEQQRISVLICTYNRHTLLSQALDALINRTAEKPEEVIIVNGGDDQADTVVRDFMGKQRVDIRLVKTENVNLATSRNIGLKQCAGDIVAMTDDDAEVSPDWITQIKRLHHEHPEAGGIGGVVIGASSDASLLSRLSDLVTFPQPDTSQYVRTLPGVNVSYKRAALEQIGLQDETLFRGEDVDFNWRIKRAGYEIYFDPAMKVLHHHRPSLKKFFYQHYMYGRAYYLVRKKWPEMYCVYPHRITNAREVLKLGHFFVAIFYQPIITSLQLRRRKERLVAIPILTVNHMLWKLGMFHQYVIEHCR